LKPWQPIRIFLGKGANSIPIISGEISQIHSSKYLYKILKAHLIYRVSFFVFSPFTTGNINSPTGNKLFLMMVAGFHLQSQ